MIQKVREEIPDLSLEQLCHLFTVSRSWYYEQITKPEEDEEETALQDRIEEIILEFSGEEAEANLDVFLEQMYNMKRLHSSLRYVPPVEFEEAYTSFVHANA